jgi:DNA polymerase-3 subunit beta
MKPDTLIQTDIEDAGHLGKTPQPRSATLKVRAGTLSAAMTRASGAVGRSATVPILACVLLRIGNGLMTIEATNMELAIRQEIPITGSGAQAGCVNAALLAGVAARLPEDGEITLTFSTGALTLLCGRSKVTLTMLPAEEYPVLTGGHFPVRFTVPCVDLGAMLERAKPFISTEVSRAYLCGVNLVATEDKLRFSATNSNDLCVTELLLSEGVVGMPEIIIPTPAVVEMGKMASGTRALTISVSETRLSCEMPGITMVTKLIDAKYPDCQRIIPRSNANVLRVQAAEMLRALGLTGLLVDGQTPWTRLELTTGSVVTLSSGSGADAVVYELADGTFEYTGADLTMSFWNRSLVEPLRLAGKTMEFRFQENVPFAAQDADDPSAIYVAMSIKR